MSLLLKKLSNCLLYNFSYKHALDGVLRVAKEEGILKLFNGAQWASSRAVMVTVGQLCFYDVIKAYLLTTPYFKDNLTTHFTSSLGAVRILYVLTSWNVSWEILCIVYRVLWQNSLREKLNGFQLFCHQSPFPSKKV